MVRRADEYGAVTARRRIPVHGQQPLTQNVARLLECHRTNTGHRPEIRQDLEHAGRTRERRGSQRGKVFQPLAPRRLVGPRGEAVDDGQRERPQVPQVLQVALVALDARRLRLFALEFTDADLVVGRQPREPATPPFASLRAGAPADDR